MLVCVGVCVCVCACVCACVVVCVYASMWCVCVQWFVRVLMCACLWRGLTRDITLRGALQVCDAQGGYFLVADVTATNMSDIEYCRWYPPRPLHATHATLSTLQLPYNIK